jgi:hypothetical protein
MARDGLLGYTVISSGVLSPVPSHPLCCPTYEQHLDNLRRKDSLRGAETAEISVRLGNYSASHFEGSAYGQMSIR